MTTIAAALIEFRNTSEIQQRGNFLLRISPSEELPRRMIYLTSRTPLELVQGDNILSVYNVESLSANQSFSELLNRDFVEDVGLIVEPIDPPTPEPEPEPPVVPEPEEEETPVDPPEPPAEPTLRQRLSS